MAANRVARWDGSTWQPFGLGMNDDVRALTVYNGELIAGGDFDVAGGVQAYNIASWNALTEAWQPLGSGIARVSALVTYHDTLIDGGLFRYAGGVYARHIARWDGASWDSLGSGMRY